MNDKFVHRCVIEKPWVLEFVYPEKKRRDICFVNCRVACAGLYLIRIAADSTEPDRMTRVRMSQSEVDVAIC